MGYGGFWEGGVDHGGVQWVMLMRGGLGHGMVPHHVSAHSTHHDPPRMGHKNREILSENWTEKV